MAAERGAVGGRVHPDRSDRKSATGATPTTGTPPSEDPETTGSTKEHVLTLLAFLAVAVVALAFDKNIGFAAITAAVLLSVLTPRAYKDTVKQIAWPTSTALLPVIIPIAIPLVAEGGLSAGFFVAALAVSSTIVDVSPFSTNGALMLANKPDTIDESTYYKQILTYATIVTLVGPALVWAALVLPGWS